MRRVRVAGKAYRADFGIVKGSAAVRMFRCGVVVFLPYARLRVWGGAVGEWLRVAGKGRTDDGS